MKSFRLPHPSLRSSWWILLALVFSPFHLAHAYLDPNTGSYIIQVAIGAVFAVAYAFRNFWYKLISLFTRQKNTTKSSKTNQRSKEKVENAE